MSALQPVPDASSGLALEANLFSARQPDVLLWAAETQALVCPAAYERRSDFDESARRSADRGWPVNLRPTGGGVVPQGPGVLNLAIAFTADPGFTIDDGYRLITRPIRSCLERADLSMTAGATPGSFCDGRWNLSVAGQKVVGTAQRWRPMKDEAIRVLAHALILVHGEIGPGAAAVAAFHRDLALEGEIRTNAHSTLEAMLGPDPSVMDHLVTRLHAAARRELTHVGLAKGERTAA